MTFWLIGVGESLPTEGQGYRRWRTGMLAKALLERGHKVVWWTSSVHHFSKTQIVQADVRRTIAPNFDLQFLHSRLYRRNISFARFANHLDLARGFERVSATQEPPDAIFTTFPPIELCQAAVRYGVTHNVPTVVDVNDLWPDEMWSRVPAIARPLVRLLLRPLSRKVREAMSEASAICAISRTYLEWAARHAGREPDHRDMIFGLGYPGDIGGEVPGDAPRKAGEPRRFLFVGTMARSIDLATVIDAARLLANRADIRIVVVGSGEQENALRAAAVGLPNVEFTGWATQEQIKEFARGAYAGLAAYAKGALMSLPNKIYEYMRFGLPILSSLTGEAADLLRTSGAGMSYDAGDSRELAQMMARLADDTDLRNNMAAQARAVFGTRFSESAIYPRLAERLEAMARRTVFNDHLKAS